MCVRCTTVLEVLQVQVQVLILNLACPVQFEVRSLGLSTIRALQTNEVAQAGDVCVWSV